MDMAKQSAAATQPAPLRTQDPASPAESGAVFDLYGMPLTTNAARTMSATNVESAMAKALTNLRRKADPAGIATAGSALDSLEVIWLLAKFDKPFGQQLIDVTKVDRARWSNLGDVAGLVHESIGRA
jgi:hypothetical protein